MSSYPLKYHFHVQFKDGTTYAQSADDSPRISASGSAFTDIKDRLDEITHFSLYQESDLACLVDLTDGHFEVAGIPIQVQDPSVNFPGDTVYRLIYFRRIVRTRTGDVDQLDSVQYHIGWQTTLDGKNYQQTIAVK